jgi:hypothetical protein
MTFTPTPSPASVRTNTERPTVASVLMVLGLRLEQIADGRYGTAGAASTPRTLADNLDGILDRPVHDYGWSLRDGGAGSFVSCGGESLIWIKTKPNTWSLHIVRDDSAGSTWDWERTKAGDAFSYAQAGPRPQPTYRLVQSG